MQSNPETPLLLEGGTQILKPERADEDGDVLLKIPDNQVRQTALPRGISDAQNAMLNLVDVQHLPASESRPLFGAEANCPRNEL